MLNNTQHTIKVHPVDVSNELILPYLGKVNAGFTSPARDYIAETVDLNKLLIRHPSTTFVWIADGNCLTGANIQDKDILIVDKLIEPNDGDIAVCWLDGEWTVKRIKVEKEKDMLWLMPDNKEFKPIKVTEDNSFMVFGIVTSSIKVHRRF